MNEFFGKIMAFVESTKLIDQLAEVDYVGLFTNPWFLVPFVALVLYLIWKQRWRDMIFIAIHGMDLGYSMQSFGQCPCLVEDHCLDLTHDLEGDE